MTERDEVAVNYDYPVDQHQSWKDAAKRKGQPLKEWIRRSLNEAAEREAEEDRQRRSR